MTAHRHKLLVSCKLILAASDHASVTLMHGTPPRLIRAWLITAFLSVSLSSIGQCDDKTDFFEKKVRPVLSEHCYSCHSAAAKKEKGGLRLDSPEAIRRGGESGPAVRANDAMSRLLLAVTHAADVPAMPPKGKLSDAAIADLRKWVMMGAPMPSTTARPAIDDARRFWSFLPVNERAAPKVSDPKWPLRKADFFILRKLDEQRLNRAPTADRRTLIRRAYFDLIGLPPTFEQVEAFATDSRPDAYERLVDELLASPRFGEKWGRHWLDVARYAEDNSTSESTCKPPRFPYRYRDWVIGALNADVPFDRFIRLQLAADLLPNSPPTDYAALGFLGLSPVYHKEPKLSKDVIAAFVADEWDERVDAISRGFLGLTVACARCHDHKFDPISTEDYYALAGVMANTQLAERPLMAGADTAQEALTTVRNELLDATQRLGYAKEMRGTALKEKKATAPFERQIKLYQERVDDLKRRERKLDTALVANVVRDAGTWVNGDDPSWTEVEYRPGLYRDLPVFIRGNPARPGEFVPRHFPRVLAKGDPRPFRQGSGRRELADAIATDASALTARVYVNRVWGWVFGRHLVGTPSNFGALGERPTHPELLDDLAARFIAHRWSTKWLVRELVTSASYRQSSRLDEKAVAVDPDNRWHWRGSRKRLELEAWRDAMLQVSGRLDLAGGGPSDDLDRGRGYRRTVYGKVSRQRPSDIHRLFDLPDPKAHGEKREVTTTPLQQLYFLNSPFVRQMSASLARTAVDGKKGEDAVAALFRKALLRDPTSDEMRTASELVKPKRPGDSPAWELLAQALLVSNEFLFLE
ncbi:MAG TPA: PSD1 and planctomycete cytochrome C domain-containing protein [Gemmataceae bacterium]